MPLCERCGYRTTWSKLRWCAQCERYYCQGCLAAHAPVHQEKPWLYYLTPQERWARRKSNEH